MNQLLPTLSLTKSVSRNTEVVVVGFTHVSDAPTLVGVSSDLEKSYQKKFGTSVLDLATDLGADAKRETVRVLPSAGQRLVVVGLGDADVTPEGLRCSLGNAMRAINKLPGENAFSVAVSLETADPELIKAAGEGALLGNYQIEKVTGEPTPNRVNAIEIVSSSTRAEAKDALAAAQTVASAVCQARDWVNTPPNLLYPETFAASAKALAKDVRIDVEVLDERALERGGYGGVLAVGGGSSRGPRVVRYEYKPRGAFFHLALVGKGVTFDSGGLDIKPANGMGTMKCDMSGAAAVLAAVRAIAELGLKIHVTGYAGMVENLPSSTAYRSSDVLTMFGGKTVENMNTDAEGRLVMADLIARAGTESPDMIVDVATLTGACMVALGLRTAGLMASDDDTADRVLDAAETAGEDFWQLPIPEHIDKALDSKIADMRSTSGDRYGGALAAGAFLHRFVPQGVAWAHLDIAGPAFNDKSEFDYVPVGGTGSGVRTLVALAQSLSS